ncbi:glycosyltransferase family 4 protein [Halanaeroarchaeum sp. HSR-CO]|uniref:glycosyltransferase family 4 protein n=1 Tax=Halanaeroarchaeum sp. HSR-CO TaxID=2866382 RepID=UPI00217E7A0A|nr:glycosyltransferase family 4 protein [Halanaeroarchaeum sp. HSR-CO]
MTLNVLIASGQWGIGGTEKAAELLLRNLGSDFNAYGAGLHRGGARADSLLEDEYDIYFPDDSDDFANYLQNNAIDIIHSHSGDPELISEAAAKAGTPIVVRTDQFGRYFQPDNGKVIDYFFFPSQSILLRTLMLNQISLEEDWPRKMGLLYNPLDIDNVSQGMSMRSRYNIPETAPVVGKIGRPAPEKWGKLTIDAFDRVVKSVPNAQLFLVGVPDKIKNAIQSYGWGHKVTYEGVLPPDKVKDFYATIDVLAHTSAIGESYGYVIAEAMANGVVPVVDSTPMRDNAQIELVNHGHSGYVANSPQSYGEAITKLLNDNKLRRQFGKAAGIRVNRFSVQNVVSRLEDYYRRLSAERGLISDSDPVSLTYTSQRNSLLNFADGNNKRLNQSFGDDDVFHWLERQSWRCVTSLPIGRKPTFDLLRKGFIVANERI